MDMTIKTDTMDNSIQKNMTIKFLKLIDDWKKNKIHPLPCTCPLCLWRRYEKKSDKPQRRPYDMITFFMCDLIFDAKKNHLLESGKAKIIKKNGKTVLAFNMIDHYNAPYIQHVKQVLEKFPEFYLYDLKYLKRFRKEYFGKYARNKRYETSNLLKLLTQLESEIHKEWREKHPESPEKRKEQKTNWEGFWFAPKVANFIHSQHKKQISQRDLLRHFSNKRKEDFERIHDHLKLNYGINLKKEGYRNKTTVYYSTTKSSKGRYWKVGI